MDKTILPLTMALSTDEKMDILNFFENNQIFFSVGLKMTRDQVIKNMEDSFSIMDLHRDYLMLQLNDFAAYDDKMHHFDDIPVSGYCNGQLVAIVQLYGHEHRKLCNKFKIDICFVDLKNAPTFIDEKYYSK